MLLSNMGRRSYSYYIDVSVDQKNWQRIIDYTNYHCSSWQFLHFPSKAVRFIKLVGTHSTNSSDFDVIALYAYFNYRENQPKLIDGFVSPSYNVAAHNRARVIEGVHPIDLLDGETTGYTIRSGFTYHFIGEGAIVVQLRQPYYIDYIRLLLWDRLERAYSFYIETSTNQKDWTIAVDKREEKLQSWQQFTFQPRAVVFIRIIGTHNTVNNVSKSNMFWSAF